MQNHEVESARTESLRPKGGRVEQDAEALVMKAAAHGRPDVLGASGLAAMQRSVGNAGTAALMEDAPSVQDVVGQSGSPLQEDVRGDMEQRLGADFSDVRIHTGSDAHASAQSVDAHAYTVGSDIVFQSGQFDPASTTGQTTLAHELTHVVQQRNGPVEGTDAGDGIKVSSPDDRFEQEAAARADEVMSAPTGAVADAGAHAAAAPSAVQREAGDEEELQMLAVQRESGDEEEELQMLAVQRSAEHDHDHDED